MPTLKDFVVMHGKKMCQYTQFNGDLASFYEERYFYPEIPNFGETMWTDMARELRGLPLLYDNFDEFWADFVPWWRQRVMEFARIYVTVALQYNLLHNYDRTETITETTSTRGNETTRTEDSRQGESEAAQTQSAEDSTTSAGTVKNVVMDTETTTEKVNGFNSAEGELSTKGQTERTLDSVTTNNSDNATTGESNATASGQSKHSENSTTHGTRDNSGTVESTREVRMYGNIGVTTAQQMLSEERRLMDDHVIGYITKEFKLAFCLLVY